jgi:hypothetical protein
MSQTGNDISTSRTALLDTGDTVVVIGKPGNSNSGDLYIEVHRPIAKKSVFYLERHLFEEDPNYGLVHDKAKPIIEALLEGEDTMGINKLRIGLNFFSLFILDHFSHLTDAYLAIALKKIEEIFGKLDVYMLRNQLSTDERLMVQRIVPSVTHASNSESLKHKLYSKTHRD